MRSRNAAALALLAGLVAAGCGSGAPARPSTGGTPAGTIRMALAGVSTLDPARATTAQQTELDWALYTGLVTYPHARGEAGTELIPGVATTLPRVSDGGRLYTVTLRHGLRFSDGRALRASDVVATIERAVRTQAGPVRGLLLGVLDGAAAYAAGRARSISGVIGDDASGQVTIRLRRRDGAFDALLADPALGIVPAGTPVRERPGHPPPGIGPYRLRAVHAGRSFTLARNPYWTALPGIPAGQVDVEVTLVSDVRASALAVLNDVLDVQDPAQPLPWAMLRQLRDQAAGRAVRVAGGHPLAYLFLGTDAGPFDDRLAREGVVEGLGAQALVRAGARTVSAACGVVPAVTSTPTPDGCPAPTAAGGQLATARSLVARSGTAGEAVSVWAPRTGPEGGWMRAQVAVLRSIGYAARLVTVPDRTYRTLIALVPRPTAPVTTGVAPSRSSGDRPLLARRVAKASGGPAPVTADAVVEGRLASDMRVPSAGTVVVALGPAVPLRDGRGDHRVAFGEQTVPELMSSRMNESAAVINPVQGLDFTSLRLR